MAELKQRVSAPSDAQQGVPTPDVRTATEIQRLTQLGSQRLGVLARVMSATTMRPMVRMMIANIQDALALSGSVKLEKENMPSQLEGMVEDGYMDFDVSKDLQGDIDYLVIDGTLPPNPHATRKLDDMLQIMNQTGPTMEYNAGQIAEEAYADYMTRQVQSKPRATSKTRSDTITANANHGKDAWCICQVWRRRKQRSRTWQPCSNER